MGYDPTVLGETVVPHLINCTTNDETIVCISATIVLGELHASPAQSVPALINCLQSSNHLIRSEATKALRSFGTNATLQLQKSFGDSNPSISNGAFQALSQTAPGTDSHPPNSPTNTPAQ